MNGPKIALISGDFPPTLSGIGDYTEKLAGAMARLGGDITVVTSKVDGIAFDQYPFKIRAEMTGWSSNDTPQLLNILKDYDIAHIQYPSGAYGRKLMINFLPRNIRKQIPSTKSLVTIHDFRVMRWRWRARVSPMLWNIDGLIHVDEKDGPFLRSWMPFSQPPTEVIPIAANAEPVECSPDDRKRWREELGFKDDEIVVAFFGVLYPHKGLPELHQAIQNLRASGNKVRLLAMGDFDRDAEWRAGIEADLRKDHSVWIQGAPLDRVSQCLHASDLAALPFHSGTSTNRGSMLATLAHGLPTVTTNGPCTPPDIDKLFDLSLVPIQSADALTKAIGELINNLARREQMRKNALDTMLKMSWPTVARQTLDFYNKLLQPKTNRKSA